MTENNLILLAEDDEDDQELIKIAFEKVASHHILKIVQNGQEVLNALAQQSQLPCLILLDLNMPLMNGIQTLQALSRESRYLSIPKIILTTSGTAENKEVSISNGAADYFVKPPTMREFVITAQKILTYCQ